MASRDIPISETTYQRLQKHAQPFVDTPDLVINRALDALEQAAPSAFPLESGERQIDTRSLPRLTHTKVLNATIEGTPVDRPNWNRLLDEVLRIAARRLRSFEELRKQCPANLAKGRKDTEGFAYLPDLDLSVQRQDANSACRTIVALAQRLGLALDVGFMWRPKEDALYPGEHGRIQIRGSQTL
ncbi:T4SS efffector SepA family protein [Parvibaculum sp.]|uniref:T4SS efffector SepA family protein n=1 Tax=Parvibaculum sp. TaxID=2024848 RepID=UPI003BAA7A95